MSLSLRTSLRRLLLPASLGLLHLLVAGAAGGVGSPASMSLPVLDAGRLGYRPVAVSDLLPTERQPASPAEAPYSSLVKEGPEYAAPAQLSNTA